jgi:hypothetical protein
MKSTHDIMAINGVGNTPMLPSYYNANYEAIRGGGDGYYNANYGSAKTIKKTTKKTAKFGRPDMKQLATKMNLKTSSNGKPLTLQQIINKITKSLSGTGKSKEIQNRNNEGIKAIAKKVKVATIKGGKELSTKSLWSNIRKVVDVSKVTKKSTNTPTRKSSTDTLHGRPRRVSKFGSWWDNTQKTYCAGAQCSAADQVGSGYPYHGDWKPYASIRGPSFGSHSPVNRYRKNLSLPYDRNSVMMDIPTHAPSMPGWYNSQGGFPSAVSSPFPFVNNFGW